MESKAIWQRIGGYEYEYAENDYTGWCRLADNRSRSGQRREWNWKTGETRYV